MTYTDIQLVRGPEAEALAADDAFVAQWSALVTLCPWSTGFQSPGYVRTWYGTYGERFEPMLILSRGADGTLQALLTLAICRRTGRVAIAGDVQAEYQAWLSTPEFGDAFPLAALRRLRAELPSAVLKFNYLPPGAPTGWLADPGVSGVHLLRSHARPVLRFEDGKAIAESLAKKSNKNRLRQMEKLGPVRFERVTDPVERARLFAEVIPYHDARHTAMRGSSPFHSDAFMRRFGEALLAVPDLLHVTVLRCGDQLAAAHIGVLGRREVEFGLVAHSPWLARYSPGKFLVYFLARMLMEEGYEQLDLTAGGDAYKDRMATTYDRVHTLTLFPTRASRLVGLARDGMKRGARRALAAVRVTPNQARSIAAGVRRLRPGGIVGALRRVANARLTSARAKCLYEMDLAKVPAAAGTSTPRHDCLADLLRYQSAPGSPTRQEFVSDALRRVEEGHHLYTRLVDARLLPVVWRIDRPSEAEILRIAGRSNLELEKAALVEFPADATNLPAAELEPTLRRVMSEAATAPGVARLYAAVPSHDAALAALLERVGFSRSAPSQGSADPQPVPPTPAPTEQRPRATDAQLCLTSSSS
jgi:CelD/BcsL family acetyltransferase involved in cellulose biosynthesis